MFSFLFLSTSHLHSFRSSSDYRRGLLAVCVSSPTTSKTEGQSNSAMQRNIATFFSITCHYTFLFYHCYLQTVTRCFIHTDQSVSYYTSAHLFNQSVSYYTFSLLLTQLVSYYTFFTVYMYKKNMLQHYLAFISLLLMELNCGL